ncbi:MAG: acyltransferase [Candidatus Buchananbacteria bacterium]
MQIFVNNPVQQTIIFAVIFFAAIFIFFKKSKNESLFPISLTNELKGVAIFMVIFAHLGYFMFTDTRFLYPFSILAGVGVNLFLFLSGYGLAMSSMKKKLSPLSFYLKRIIKIFIPLWIVIAGFVIIDKIFLNINWPWQDLIKYIFGYYPTNDLFKDFNSPLWFITLILFYYLVFPFLFFKERPKVSALLIFIAGLIAVNFTLPVSPNVSFFYKLHLLAFPLGIFFASLFRRPYFFENENNENFSMWLNSFKNPVAKKLLGMFKIKTVTEKLLTSIRSKPFVWRLVSVLILAVVFVYFAINSYVGRGIYLEQLVSLITMFAFIFIFIIKKNDFKILAFLGFISYEIYLIHWPIFYRYNFLYNYTPAWLATLIYIILIVVIAWAIAKVSSKINASLPKNTR